MKGFIGTLAIVAVVALAALVYYGVVVLRLA